MKRIVIAGAVAALTVAAAFGQGHGRKVFKPGDTTGVEQRWTSGAATTTARREARGMSA